MTQVGKITAKRTTRPYHAPGFTYMVGNRQAIAVLEQVVPHMHSYKLERAFASINHRRCPGPAGDPTERSAAEI